MDRYTRWTEFGQVAGTSMLLVDAAVEALAAVTPASVWQLLPAQRPVAVEELRVAA